MLEVISALKNYAIEASDGKIGTVEDFLFDDKTWKIRWLVIDTGTWLIKRRVLLHPSSIVGSDYERNLSRSTLRRRRSEKALTLGMTSRCHGRWRISYTTTMAGTRFGAAAIPGVAAL
jgi:hypothetical protein